MASALLARLRPVYDEVTAAPRTMAGSAGWPPAHGFGDPLADVLALVVHETAGWPSRDKAGTFVFNFTNSAAGNDWGIGTQFYISSDGTVFRLIDLPRKTGHAEFINSWSMGVETGHLPRTGKDNNGNVFLFIDSWRALSTAAEDIPGARALVRGINGEVLFAWWTTDTWNGPGRLPIADRQMLFSEWQYRSWAKLGRYLAEEFHVPRNFPLLPYEQRAENMNDATRFRRIILADERFDMLVRAFSAWNIDAADFDAANLAALQTDYHNAVQHPAKHKQHNRAWRSMFDAYRGFHGHGYPGAIQLGDHDCPGNLFDWHRFAREVWDWWWHPFDFTADFVSTNLAMRPYRQARRDTPLIEYYFDVPEANYLARSTTWFPGAPATPETFRLEPDSRVYAPANGTLVAARFPDPGNNPSLAFVLVRHEIYHKKSPVVALLAPTLGMQPFETEGIDYDEEPSFVYSLVMHIGRPAGMNFDQVSDGNPDWYNRLLIRLKECELGLAFHDAGSGIAEALWNSRPPGQGAQRPTVRDGWRFDRDHNLRQFVDDFKAGRLALGPHVTDDWAMPIQVILGDFLGVAGLLDKPASGPVHGIRLEVFSKDLISLDFAPLIQNAWPAAPPARPALPAVFYRSDWSHDANDALKELLASIGIDLDLVNWWPAAAAHTLSDAMLPVAARLPWDGKVFHYRPHDFMFWLNGVTRRSEWIKYKITNVAGDLVPPSAVPRSRRV